MKPKINHSSVTALLGMLFLFISSFIYADKIPVIIDTDMGQDDWMAILYVLKNKNVDVLAITVDSNGMSYCPRGAKNATMLVELATGSDKIPVYYDPPNKIDQKFGFPTVLRKSVNSMIIPGFENLKGFDIQKKLASEAIIKLAVEMSSKNEQLIILSIGTASNLAEAYKRAKKYGVEKEFKKGIKVIYKGGGAFGGVIGQNINMKNAALSNFKIEGDLNIPGMYLSNNNDAEWNIYAAAPAMQELLNSGVSIVFIPDNVSNTVNITKKSYEKLKSASTNSEISKFVANVAKMMVDTDGGWAKIGDYLDYWDPSVVVTALNHEIITKIFHNISVCVNTMHPDYTNKWYSSGSQKVVDGIPFKIFQPVEGLYYYGSILIDIPYIAENKIIGDGKSKFPKSFYMNAAEVVGEKGTDVDIIMAIDVDKFYNLFIDGLK